MSLERAIQLFNQEDARELGVKEDQIVACFAASKVIVTKEDIDQDTYSRIGYGELLELIARVSVCKFQNTDQEFLPLKSKILNVLDDLFESWDVQSIDNSKPLHQSMIFKSTELSAEGEPIQASYPEFLRALGRK